MRTRTSRLALPALAGLALLAPAPAAETASPCKPSGSTGIEGNDFGRVYHLNGRVYGCVYKYGKRVKLGRYEGDFPSHYVIGRRYLAYTRMVACGTSDPRSKEVDDREEVAFDECNEVVRVMDLKKARKKYAESAGSGHTENVIELKMKKNGSVAWLVDAYHAASEGGSSFEVHKRDTDGHDVLDRGGDIDLNYLIRLSRSNLSWKRGGEKRTATLD